MQGNQPFQEVASFCTESSPVAGHPGAGGPSMGWGAAGWLKLWYYGVAKALQERMDLSELRIGGASAGALVATGLLCGAVCISVLLGSLFHPLPIIRTSATHSPHP
jgi:hypothetical protein